MMSKIFQPVLKPLILIALICVANALSIFAQDVEAKIKVATNYRISIEGEFNNKNTSFKNLLFLQNYADVSNLANRIENLQLFDEQGSLIELEKLSNGAFLASKIPTTFQYQVNLTPSTKLTDSAHSSWLTKTQGLLMLADLLPKFDKSNSVKLDFELPNGWKITNSETNLNNIFNAQDIENAVFTVGQGWREKSFQLDKNTINFAFAGEWKFSDDEAVEMASSILTEYKNLFKAIPNPKSNIILSPFPQENSNPERWRAETRGSTVVIISGSSPYKSQAIQRLNEQLRHEIFHLWMPNGVNLSGNYGWFYEGFAIYYALRTGVEMNQIRFEDFLNTLSQANRMEQMMLDSGQNFSLIESSNKRWAGYSNYLSAKGLAVAFLCDVSVLRASKGKRNLKDVFRQIFEKHRAPNQIQDGNTAILSILNGFPELRPIVQNFIIGKAKIGWETELNSVGIKQEKTDFGIQLKVIEKPSSRQKDFLDKLGYNQWRKFGQKK